MFYDELKIGMTHKIAPVEIKKDAMLDFARKFDSSPLHLDEEYAAKTKFGKLIAPGVFSFMTLWEEYLKDDFFGEELLAGKSTKIEWLAPVFAGDELCGTATITDLIDRNAKNGIAVVVIDGFNGRGEKVLTDTTEAVVKKKPR